MTVPPHLVLDDRMVLGRRQHQGWDYQHAREPAAPAPILAPRILAPLGLGLVLGLVPLVVARVCAQRLIALRVAKAQNLL